MPEAAGYSYMSVEVGQSAVEDSIEGQVHCRVGTDEFGRDSTLGSSALSQRAQECRYEPEASPTAPGIGEPLAVGLSR